MGAIMSGRVEDYMIFCGNNEHRRLSPSALDAAFAADHPEYGDTLAIPAIDDDHNLTWIEVDTATRGQIGVFSISCPYCSPEKFWSKRFRIDRPSLAYARWNCFYCSKSGAVRADGPVDPIREAEARKRAASLATERKARNTAAGLRIWDDSVPIAGTASSAISDREPSLSFRLMLIQCCVGTRAARGGHGIRHCPAWSRCSGA